MNGTKMKQCKYCGQTVAKNAKNCPQCGATLKKSHGCLTSLLIFALIVVIAIVSFKAVFGVKKADIGEKIKFGIEGEVVVTDIQVCNTMDLFGQGNFSLAQYIDKDESAILVYFTFKNVGKTDYTVKADSIRADYKDGVNYKAELLYMEKSEGDYKLCEYGANLEQITNESGNFVAVIPIHTKAIEDTKSPLEVYCYGGKYNLR